MLPLTYHSSRARNQYSKRILHENGVFRNSMIKYIFCLEQCNPKLYISNPRVRQCPTRGPCWQKSTWGFIKREWGSTIVYHI